MKLLAMFFILVLITAICRAETTGVASWYGRECEGKLMANGKPFDPKANTCAAWKWSLGTRLKVTRGNKYVIVTVTDRGPAKRLNRLLDLSEAAFKQLSDTRKGLITVIVREVE